MKITWLGHSGFRIEIAGEVLLVDPWLTGNPMFPEDRRAEAIGGASHILLTHGHGDHAGNAEDIARDTGAPILCIHELSNILGAKNGIEATGMGKGGTVKVGEVAVTMVHATHSSSVDFAGGQPIYAGGEAGFMIAGEGHTIYVTGDTDVMADMKLFQDLHAPDIGILCAGGHYTMDMARAAYACRTFFDFATVIPCHYKTFPLLAQSAQALIDALPDTNVIEPEVMTPIEM